MFRQLKMLFIICVFALAFLFASFSYAKSPKPGPNFIWVRPHTTQDGTFIKGHWKHVGPAKKGKAWVSGHYDADGNWVAGHWKNVRVPKSGAVWVPGHRGPKGRWIPGHWR